MYVTRTARRRGLGDIPCLKGSGALQDGQDYCPDLNLLPSGSIFDSFEAISQQTGKIAIGQYQNSPQALWDQVQTWMTNNSTTVYVTAGALVFLAFFKGRGR